MKTRRCYIYTRVSTSMQVDGYSLDAQKDKLKKYAEFQDMVVAGEYSDEGKSGKNIEGRPQFLQMLKDIESGKDKVEFVLVFFVRNYFQISKNAHFALVHVDFSPEVVDGAGAGDHFAVGGQEGRFQSEENFFTGEPFFPLVVVDQSFNVVCHERRDV